MEITKRNNMSVLYWSKRRFCSNICKAKIIGFKIGYIPSEKHRKNLSKVSKGKSKTKEHIIHSSKRLLNLKLKTDKGYLKLKDRAINLYISGLSSRIVSRKLKINQKTVLNWCHKINFRRTLSDSTKGSNHRNWKGGVTPLYLYIRQLYEYKNWRNECFKRDKYVCQKCGDSKSYLNVDHVKPFIVILKENNIKTINDAINCKELWNRNNGKTLCEACHKNTKTYGAKIRKFKLYIKYRRKNGKSIMEESTRMGTAMVG